MNGKTAPQFDGQVAIVTGGTAGIGRAVCARLAEGGAKVVAVGRDRKRLEQLVSEIKERAGDRALPFRGDVRSEADMDNLAATTAERFGRIDILVASAGILRARDASLKTLNRMSVSEWEEVVDTNLKGVFLSNRAVLPVMIAQRRGQIINLSSTSGRRGYAFDTAYCAAKFGVIGLSEALAEEVRSYGVRVQVLLPGATDTPMWDQNGPIRRPTFALSAERAAEIVIGLLSVPWDTTLAAPVVEPFAKPKRDGWLGEQGGPRGVAGRAAPTAEATVSETGRGGS